jgi:hypothetical protein
MSNAIEKSNEVEESEPKGPNIILLYILLALALLAAMGFAAMVVFPFYKHRS